jgi:hypothetical protein
MRVPIGVALAFACADLGAQTTITPADFQDYQIIQRTIGTTSGTVTVSGTYAGSGIAHIEAAVDSFTGGQPVVAYQTIVANPAGGAFSGVLTVPQGGWFKVKVRGVDATGTALCQGIGAHKWGVGINVLAIGQSNMVGDGDSVPPRCVMTPVATDLAGLWSNNNVWMKLSDPYDSGGVSTEIDFDAWYGCSMIPAFVNSLSKAFPGVPLGIVASAKGATPLHGTTNDCWIFRDSVNHFNQANLYGNSISNARNAGGVELIIMHQGETDATNNTLKAQYESDLKLLQAHYRADLGNAGLPLFICQLASSKTDSLGGKNRTDSTMQRIRSAQHDSDDSTNIFLGATCIDVFVREGDDHYWKHAYDTIGGRMGNAVKHYYYPSTYTYYRGPAIQSVQFANSAKTGIDVFITHRGGTDFTASKGATTKGFLVFNDAARVTVSSTARLSAASINLTLASAITGTGRVHYLFGKRPDTTGIIRDNTPLHLPLEPTTDPLVIATPSVTVLYPNGGEILAGDSSLTITWTTGGVIAPVKIEFSADNGVGWKTITTCDASLHSYAWHVPDTASTSARIRIGEAIRGWPLDMSDSAFTVKLRNSTHAVKRKGRAIPADLNLRLVPGPGRGPVGVWVGIPRALPGEAVFFRLFNLKGLVLASGAAPPSQAGWWRLQLEPAFARELDNPGFCIGELRIGDRIKRMRLSFFRTVQLSDSGRQ